MGQHRKESSSLHVKSAKQPASEAEGMHTGSDKGVLTNHNYGTSPLANGDCVCTNHGSSAEAPGEMSLVWRSEYRHMVNRVI